MSLENRFRVSELMSSGSRAIVSQDPVSKTHTFYADSKVIVSGSSDGGDPNIPFTHVKGERDGELTGYVEKPTYLVQDLKRAVDTVVDELIAPPKPTQPDVVPRRVYNDLQSRYQQLLDDFASLTETNRTLQGRISELSAELQATLVENDSLKVQKAVLDNQFQQQIERYKDMTSKVTTAIVKSTKEANDRVRLQSVVEGLNAQKNVLRQQLLSQRQLILGLTDQLDAGVATLNAQIQSAAAQREAAAAAAEAQRLALENQAKSLEQQQELLEEQLNQAEAEIEGKNAEIAAGATLGGDSFTARVTSIKKDKDAPLTYSATRSKFEKWTNGPDILLFNYSDKPITLTFSISNTKLLNLPPTTTLTPGQKKTVSVVAREPKINGGNGAFNPNANVSARPTTQHNGTLTIKDNNGQTVNLGVSLFKSR